MHYTLLCHVKWASGGIGRRTTLKMWREIVRVRVSLRPLSKAYSRFQFQLYKAKDTKSIPIKQI